MNVKSRLQYPDKPLELCDRYTGNNELDSRIYVVKYFKALISGDFIHQ